MNNPVMITTNRLQEAYDKWVTVASHMHDCHWEFWKFIGVYDIDTDRGGFRLTPAGHRRAEMLLGPYTETVIRAWVIKKGKKWKSPEANTMI